jgi:hypothetical protein
LADTSFGTSITIGSAIGALYSLEGPGISVDSEDTSHHDMSDPWREHTPTLIDGGEVSCECKMTQANVDLLYASLGTIETVAIAWPNGVTAGFSGFVSDLSIGSADVDNTLRLSFTVKATGPVVLGGGA